MDLKPTLLLAAALFLISAPEPDSRAVAEMTRNFIVPADERALQAAEMPRPKLASEIRRTESENPDSDQTAKDSEERSRPEG